MSADVGSAGTPELQIIIPAAGNSSRLGFAKQEASVGHIALWQHLVAVCTALGYPVHLISGAWQPAARLCPNTNLRMHHFRGWSAGLGATLAWAVRQCVAPRRGYLVVLGDQWGLTTSALHDFVERWNGCSIQLARDAEHLGPPALVPTGLRTELLALQGDEGAKALLERHPWCEAPVADARLDLDTPGDLALLKGATRADC